ncbi:MAG TPA: alpha/beta fold hydrolase [Xanthobacteraceae bacterium]|jgi:pimeloyl-ACP methyl ester carboxylesterase|nr:alpha/beta fold hydrolase [Xanthobacteraceae bacterium]
MADAESLPVVLVPGLTCTARLYAEQIPALWQFGPVTVADHRRDDSMAAIARRILAAAPPRFALAGLSMGGYIAFEIMRQEPKRVVKLALLDTGARPDSPEQIERRRVLMALAKAGRYAEIPEQAFPVYVHRNRRDDAALKEVVCEMAEATGAEAYLRQQQAILSRPDSRPGLGAISCPTLVLVGEGDEATPPELAREIAAGIAGSRLVLIADSGHLSTLERPAAVTQALSEWLRP